MPLVPSNRAMKFAQNPTIKTVLLQVAVFAALFAAFPFPTQVVSIGVNCLFWLIPLALALILRPRTVAACCAGIGCGIGIFNWFFWRNAALLEFLETHGVDD